MPINLLAFHSGTSGIISKHHSSQAPLNAINAIHTGGTWFNRDATELEQQQHGTDPLAEVRCHDSIRAHPKFSNCECRIAFLATQGLSARESVCGWISRKKLLVTNQQSIEKPVSKNKLNYV
ncbi:MAG: hypothetical protein LZF63_06240 [Nitrosomonas sp.]|nr:hypothetical protein [Nitrosomonas sp.]